MLEVGIRRDEEVKHWLGPSEQFTIAQRSPPLLESSLHFVAGQVVAQWGGDALIEEDAHSIRGLRLVARSAQHAPARHRPALE